MATNLEETLIAVWRQVLVEDAKTVALGGQSYIVRHTNRSKLREVDFRFENQMLRGLEAEPKYRLSLGRTGTGGQESYAISRQRSLRGQYGRRGSELLWPQIAARVCGRQGGHKGCQHL